MMLAFVMLSLDCWFKDYGSISVASLAVLVAAYSAWNGVRTYRKSVRTRRAEFILQLHKTFFVESTFREIRSIIDGDNEDDPDYLKLIKDHDERLIDFLNYFEMIGYLKHQQNISRKDVRALVGYYLRIVKQRPRLRQYVAEYSFEYLGRLLRDEKLFDRIV